MKLRRAAEHHLLCPVPASDADARLPASTGDGRNRDEWRRLVSYWTAAAGLAAVRKGPRDEGGAAFKVPAHPA
ncbi:hypothetical protein [Frateuria terrea]|uniref:hypothetical protein n=1 Tax=Frateuria terrea TaxID=529704 RepID=UPI000B82DE8E|nr:hypothetical protein [Frateuria terrea]